MFRVAAVKHFLTYSQCPLDKLFVFEFIKDLEPNFKYLCVSNEKHQDGNGHVHVYIEFHSKRDIKSESHFNIDFGDQTYHPNHKAGNKNSATYTKKDGDFVEEGIAGSNSEWKAALQKRTASEAFEHILDQHPRDAIIFHSAIKSFLETHYEDNKPWSPEFQITSFSPPAELMEWVMNNVTVS